MNTVSLRRWTALTVVLALPGISAAGISRHNEQGLSPTHSYAVAGPDEAVSNLNGNLVIKSVAAQVQSVPLPITVERSFNSHWRSPLIVHQFDLDYDRANEKETDDDGNEKWKIDYDDQEGIPHDDMPDKVATFLRRSGFEINEAKDQPRGMAWTIGISSMVLGEAISDIKSLNLNYYPESYVTPAIPKSQGLDKGLQWANVGLSAISLGMQLSELQWDRFAWNTGGSGEYTVVTLASLAYSTGNLVNGLNMAINGLNGVPMYGSEYLPVLGMALSVYNLSQLDPDMPGYEVQVASSMVGLSYGFACMANPALMANPYLSLAVFSVQVGAMLYTMHEADKIRWETAEYAPQPWQYSVNGYVAMFGNKFQEDLTRDSRATGRQLVRQYSGNQMIGFLENDRGSMHPMPEMNLVRGDGGGDRFILADREPIRIKSSGNDSDTLWYSYIALSNTNRTKVYFADIYPYTKDQWPDTRSQPEDFYLVKEPGGTWARFGGKGCTVDGANAQETKGIYREHGKPHEVFWALPNAVGVYRASGKGDSLTIVRDTNFRIVNVLHSSDPRMVSIKYGVNEERVATYKSQADTINKPIDDVIYGMINHDFDDGYGSYRPSGGVGFTMVPDGRVRMVSSIKRQVDNTKWIETKYRYSAGNLVQIERPTGAIVDYQFKPANARSIFDGFCERRTERSPTGTVRDWTYSYRGWGSEDNGVSEDGGTYLYTNVTRKLTAVDGPGAAGTDKPVESSTSELYRFSVAMDGINIRHTPGHVAEVSELPPEQDGAPKRAVEYRSSRLHLETEILGAESQGKRTDYVYLGDRMMRKMERMGRDTSMAPVITLYDYDGIGNLVGERVNPTGELEQFEQSLLLSQSPQLRDSVLKGKLPYESVNWNALKSSYRSSAGHSFDASVRLEILDKNTIYLVRNEADGEFWKDSIKPSLNPTRIKDSAYWATYPASVRSKAQVLKDILGGFMPDKEREANERIARMVADSMAQAHLWRSMPESALVNSPMRNESGFRPWGRYLSGMRVGTFTTRKHPDTASEGSGIYGELTSYDSMYLRPRVKLLFINGWTIPSQQYSYSGSNPYIPTGTISYTGWKLKPDGEWDMAKYRVRYDSVQLDDTYHQWPIESHSWVATQEIDSTTSFVKPSGKGDFVTYRVYDERGRVTSEKAPNDAITTTVYDGLDRVVRVNHPDGSHKGTRYEDKCDAGGIIRQIDTLESGRIHTVEFDALGRMLAEHDKSSTGNLTTSTRYSFGVSDKLVWTRDPDGRETHRTYDGIGRLLSASVKKPGLGWYERTYRWNDYDRILTERDALGRTTAFHYNLYGQDVKVTRRVDDSLTYEASYQYDTDGNPVVVVAPNRDTTKHVFDWKKQVVQSVYPDDLEVRNTTDWTGAVLRTLSMRRSDSTQRDETWVTYDAQGRKDSLWVVGDTRMSQRYVWDVNGGVTDKGRLLAVRLGTGVTASYQYNPMGTMTRRILSGTGFGQSFADTLSWTVRAGDQARMGMVLPGGVSQSYIYDGLDRLGWMSLKDPSGQSHEILDSVRYLPGGMIDSVRYGNGVGQKYGYDSTRPLLRSMISSKDGTQLHRLEMTYDDEGNIETQTRPNGEKALFEYDGLYRLKLVRYPTDQSSAGSLQYKYDLNGNRLGFVHEFGNAKWDYLQGTNLLQSGTSSSEGFRKYGWDRRGNLATETRWSANPGTGTDNYIERRQMAWNVRNELERAVLVRRGADGYDSTVVGMLYGEDGNRVLKAVVDSVSGTDTTWRVTNRWVYDGTAVVADSGASGPGWTWHAYNGLSRVAELSGGDTARVRFLLTDHLGTVQAILDDTGAVVGRYQLDPYGNLEGYQGSASTALLYTGKGFDADVGAWYFNARFYDAERGAFIGRDPGGQYASPYAYAGSYPLLGVDQDGRRTYFVNGIRNPNLSAPPEYAPRFAAELTAKGVNDVRLFAAHNAQSGFSGTAKGVKLVREAMRNIDDAASYQLAVRIATDLKSSPLQSGEQLNVIGYSGGGPLAINAAAQLKGIAQVDNIVLIGSPVNAGDPQNVGRVTNIVGGMDPLGSYWPSWNNIRAGWFGHTDYFAKGNISTTANLVSKEIK